MKNISFLHDEEYSRRLLCMVGDILEDCLALFNNPPQGKLLSRDV